MSAPHALGELVARDTEVFRACSSKNFLSSTKTEISDRAYLRRRKDDDGLSLGLTPEDAVSHLDRNFGVIGALAGAIQDLPSRNLAVRHDPEFPGHALLLGLPYVEENETLATDVAWELKRLSRIVYKAPYYPVGHPRHQDTG
jgi:hypothetical protein